MSSASPGAGASHKASDRTKCPWPSMIAAIRESNSDMMFPFIPPVAPKRDAETDVAVKFRLEPWSLLSNAELSMIGTQIAFRLTLACLFVGFSACSPPAGNAPTSIPASSDTTSNAQIAQLKEKLWEAIRAKNAQNFLHCFFIEERFN